MMVMVMVMTRLEDQVLQLGKKRKRKIKIKEIKATISNRFLFWHSRHHRGYKYV
jgi:hypothetical protein